MNKDYEINQKAQKKSFKKYQKYIRRIILWIGLGVVSTFVFPSGIIYNFLKGFLSEYIAGSISVWAQILCMGASVVETIVNSFKAVKEKSKINDLQDEEENIIDVIMNENDELKKKVESLEKTKSYSNQNNLNYQKDKEKRQENNIDYENEKEKKFVK